MKESRFPTFKVLGTPLTATNYDELAACLLSNSLETSPLTVDFTNTQIVTLRRHDPDFLRLTSGTDLFIPDGMPLVWVMNILGAGLRDRVYGPEFTKKFFENCPAGFTHYLVGGSRECGKRFVDNFSTSNPTLQFVGSYHGACSSKGILADDAAVLDEIRVTQPTFVWVGLGTPKQYYWINRAREAGIKATFLAVGFAFDVNAGTKSDAPAWAQRAGLTWLFRFAAEPARLGPRYLKFNSLFLWYLFRQIALRTTSRDSESGKMQKHL